jgi:hypothetical protein
MKALQELCKPGGKYDLETEAGRQAFAVKVLKRIQLELPAQDLVSLALDTDNSFGVGDTPQWWDLDGLTVYEHEPGSFSPRSKVVKKVYTATPRFFSCTAELNFVDLKSGRYGSLAEVQSMIRDRMIGKRAAVLWALLKASVSSGDANYASASTNLTKAALDQAIRYLTDKGSKPRLILGRHLAVDKIADFADTAGIDWSEQARRLIEMDGMLGVYRGVPVVAINAFQDENDVNIIDNANVFVIGDNLGRHAPTVDLDIRQWEDPDTLKWCIKLFEEYAQVVFNDLRALYRIEIT